jgi:hypothetical protein
MRTLLLCLLACGPLLAGEVKVGEAAPKFMAAGIKVNGYDFVRTNADCSGDVIFIMEWNVRDVNSCKALERVNDKWLKFGGKGLWVFAVHRLKETTRQVELYKKTKGWTFCAPMGSFYDDDNDFGKFHHDDNEWRTTVIGVDGKVTYYDKAGFESALDAALKQIVYPGLGRHEVNVRAGKPAKYFAERKYGLAISEAQKVIAVKPGADAESDLELIVSRAEGIARKRNGRIDDLLKDKRYDLVMPELEALMDEYKGHDVAKEAKEKFNEIEKDKTLKPEFVAYKALKQAIADVDAQPDVKFIAVMQKFAKDYPEVRAGSLAHEMAKAVQADIDRRAGH